MPVEAHRAKSKLTSRCIILLIFTLLLCLGLPVWWVTTTVYRANIPYRAIENAVSRKFEKWPLILKIGVLYPEDQQRPTSADLFNLKDAFSNQLQLASIKHSEINNINYHIEITSNKYNFTQLPQSDNLQALDDQLMKIIPTNSSSSFSNHKHHQDYTIFVILRKSVNSVPASIGKYRHAWIEIPDMSHKGDWIQLMGQMTNDMISSPVKPESQLKRVSYELSFSLLNEDPHSAVVEWDFANIQKKYIDGFVETVSSIFKLSVNSQVVHYTTLKTNPLFDASTNVWYLTPDLLPYFVDPNEWKVGGASSANETTLNFAVFLPSRQHSPLVIKSSKDGPNLSSNGFTIPNWGGVVIYNPSYSENTSVQLDMPAAPFSVIIAQIRQLLGFPTFRPLVELKKTKSSFISYNVVPAIGKGASLSEVDSLRRALLIQLLGETQRTLAAFSRMISTLTNIPISEGIIATLESALSSFEEANDLAELGEYDLAYERASQALISADTAFFDKDMVGMLYFPDQHQFAIYVPLFLPITFPLLNGIFSEFRHRRQKSSTK